MPDPTPKARLYREFARIGKALSSPHRLDILDLLGQGEKDVETLARGSGLGVKNTSAHLRTLRHARLVEGRREGTHVHYRLAGEDVLRLVREVQSVASTRLAEVERVTREFYRDPHGMEPIGAEELLERVRCGEVTVLDVRPADEYRAGHIPGARSIPLDELSSRLGKIPRDQEVVAYCRGPWCMMSLDAVEWLRERGFRARVMKEGVPEWRAAGRRVEQGVGE